MRAGFLLSDFPGHRAAVQDVVVYVVGLQGLVCPVPFVNNSGEKYLYERFGNASFRKGQCEPQAVGALVQCLRPSKCRQLTSCHKRRASGVPDFNVREEQLPRPCDNHDRPTPKYSCPRTPNSLPYRR